MLAVVAFSLSVWWYLKLEEAQNAALSWWVYLPGPIALSCAVLARVYVLHQAANGNFSLGFCLVNLVPRAAKNTATTTVQKPPPMNPAPKPVL